VLGVQSLGPVVPHCLAEDAAGAVSAGSGALSRIVGAGAAAPSAGTVTAAERDADAERDAWVVLMSVSGLGPVSFGALLGAFGSAGAVLAAAAQPGGPARLMQALADATSDGDAGPSAAVFDACATTHVPTVPEDGGAATRRRASIGEGLATRICEAATGGAAALDHVRALGLTVVTLEEPAYPDRLRQVDLPPPLLFVRGSAAALVATSAVAVVGTRWPTDKGRLVAGWIGSAIARTGAAVVSGLAVGIDGAAHAAVVAEGGTTVAVLGGGHARLFPKAHERLADAIVAAGGAIVSELPPDTMPSRGTFPRRNRLVSGLSDATVVVEAGRRSGALITAGWALEQGRECFLVPGPLEAPASAGCLAFLRSFPGQARVVCGIDELIEDLGLGGGPEDVPGSGNAPAQNGANRRRSAPPSRTAGATRAAVLASLGPVERALAEELARGPATADQLAGSTSLTGAAVLSALTLLELRGLATGAYGRYSPSGALASWCAGARR
jgi:DNA processing protein